MSISGLYLSYMVVAVLLLYKRSTGAISSSKTVSGAPVDELVNTAGARLVWGPFHLPGLPGILVNAFAIVYMAIAVFFSFWPPMRAVTAETFNFSVAGTVAVVVFSFVYYFVRARRVYSGPVVEVH